MPGRIRISAKEVVKDIREGLTDDQLTAKYGISPPQLQSLFAQVVDRGMITQSELDARKPVEEDFIDLDIDPSLALSEPTPYVPPESSTQEHRDEHGAPKAGDPVLKRYGRNAVLGIVFGLMLQIAAGVVSALVPKSLAISGLLILLVGTAILVWGCYCLMKKKGQHGALALLGLPSCFGLIILLVLPNRYKESSSGGSTALAIVAIAAGVVVFVAVAGIVLAIAIPYYVAYKRTACDRATSADVGRLAATLQRLKNEAEDLDMTFDEKAVDTFAATNGLKYLVGPYYGWKGCSKRCRSLIRLSKHKGRWVIEGAAVKGAHPRSNSRYVYRAYVVGDGDLPATIGTNIKDAHDGNSLHWNSYPSGNTLEVGQCYTNSMLGKPGTHDNPVFTIRPPRRAVRCGSLLKK